MSSTSEFRQYAAQCITLSERIANPLDKARLIEMAQQFLRFAEKRESGRPDLSEEGFLPHGA
jgi:hypothetical protein